MCVFFEEVFCVYGGGCVSVYRCLRTEVGTKSCDAGVTGSCKVSKMGARDKLKVSQPLRHMSSSEVVFLLYWRCHCVIREPDRVLAFPVSLPVYFILFPLTVRTELRALSMLGKCCTIEQPSVQSALIITTCDRWCCFYLSCSITNEDSGVQYWG